MESSVDFFATVNIPWGHIVSTTNSLDIRYVSGLILIAPAKERTNRHPTWFKSYSAMLKGPSKSLQWAVLDYAADQFVLEPVVRATGIHRAHPETSMATLDHSVWWRRNFGLSDWILVELVSSSAQNGRGLTIAKLFQGGKHMAMMPQKGMACLRSVTHTEK